MVYNIPQYYLFCNFCLNIELYEKDVHILTHSLQLHAGYFYLQQTHDKHILEVLDVYLQIQNILAVVDGSHKK